MDFLSTMMRRLSRGDFYLLRHEFVTEPVQEGVSSKDVKELARHSTITLKMHRYAHATLAVTTAAVGRLSAPSSPRTGAAADDA